VQIESKSKTLLSLNPWGTPFEDYDVYSSINDKLLSEMADLHDSPDSYDPYFVDEYLDYSELFPSEEATSGAAGAPAAKSAPTSRASADSGAAAAPAAAAAPPPPPDGGVCVA
jgi:hypothetical protein